jgi:hypothetical protein
MALTAPLAGWPTLVAHHPQQSFVPFRKERPARLRRSSPAAAAAAAATAAAATAEPDSLPLQLEQVGALTQSLTNSAASAGVPPTTLLAAAAVIGAHLPSCRSFAAVMLQLSIPLQSMLCTLCAHCAPASAPQSLAEARFSGKRPAAAWTPRVAQCSPASVDSPASAANRGMLSSSSARLAS